MAKLYGWGASVVIVGALFKIQHYKGAGIMLVIGLGTEAVIFFFSAFEPPHEEYDWSLVYPELAGMHGDEKMEELDKGSLTEQLDNMLEEAKIGPELLDSLGTGLKSLSDNTNKLSKISDASVATNEFVSNMKEATSSVDQLKKSYNKAADSVTSSADELASAYSKATDSVTDSASMLANSYSKASKALETFSSSNQDSFEQSKIYADNLQKVSKNLSSLNAAYELQLNNANEHLKATEKTYAGIQQLMEHLSASVTDTKKYRDEMASLSNNLSSLNTIYGNMLTAMSAGGRK